MQQLKSEITKAIPEALANFDQLPDSAYIRLPVMKGLYGVSSATIWRGVKQGTIPKPIKLTEHTTAWSVSLVRESLAAKVANNDSN
jgi:predicted DNA-binding transcriptional regulator AlpA